MPRDFEYEQANAAYDEQYEEDGVKCKHFDLCDTVLPLWWYDCKGRYRCTNCDVLFGVDLEFRDNGDECAICFDVKKQVKYPSGCSHWFCVSCAKKILFVYEWEWHLSPIPFGCPPCPQGCTNPLRGPQCGCEEYDSVQDQWKQTSPDEYNLWDTAEERSIQEGHNSRNTSCPLCRAGIGVRLTCGFVKGKHIKWIVVYDARLKLY